MNPSLEDLPSPEDQTLALDPTMVCRRYESLHPLDEDAQNSALRLIHETSLTKVNEYLDGLANAFDQLPPQLRTFTRDPMWKFLLCRPLPYPNYLVDLWRIDETLNREFVRLAFFHRYPKWAAERPTSLPTMLQALAALSSVEGEKLWHPSQLELPDAHIKTLKEGYNHEYLRNNAIVKPILECLSNYAKDWQSTKYLAPYTALIGPSMSGKTRLLMQLSETICVIYICLRPPTSTGLPPRSVLANEIQLADLNVPELLVHFYRLLAAIFDVVANFFSNQTADLDEKQRLLLWYKHNHESGGHLATQVRDAMKEIGEEKLDASTAFEKNLRRLESSTRFISNPELKVLLAFDEARALIQMESNDDQKLSYFCAIRRVLSQVPSNLKFFGIFTDTTSNVANFSPTLHNDPSARPKPDSKELYAPIYAIGTFDSKVPSSPPKTWDELLSPRRLFCYGIPFFRIYVETAEKPPQSHSIDKIVGNVRTMAINKLLCIPRTSANLSEGQMFALLGCTIQPQIFEAAKLNSELVSSHMAHCLYISPTRERMISEYPSQFTLSMAANQFLTEDDSRLISCIKALTSFMQQGLISSGNSGELVSRIILLRAMQKAMSNSPIPTNQTNIPYGCSVQLVDFLKALTEKEEPTGEQKTASKRTRAGKKKLMEKKALDLDLNMNDVQQARLLKEGRLFWNHFIQISYTPQPAEFLNFLYRGLAVQCKPNQKGFDQMFTIYLAPEHPESTLSEDCISFCGVQAKNGSFKFKEEGPKWNSTFAEVNLKGSIPYLIILFSFKTRYTKYTLPPIPQRGSLIFHGLDEIGCLTSEIRIALKELLSVDPDVREFHKGNDHIRGYVETTRPAVYRVDGPGVDLFNADEGI